MGKEIRRKERTGPREEKELSLRKIEGRIRRPSNLSAQPHPRRVKART